MDLDHPTNADVAAVPLARSEQRPAAVSRRGFLAWSAAMPLAACADAAPTPRSLLPTAAAPSPEATPRPASGTPPSPAPSVTTAPSTAPSSRRILIRDTALAEGRNDRLQVGISL